MVEVNVFMLFRSMVERAIFRLFSASMHMLPQKCTKPALHFDTRLLEFEIVTPSQKGIDYIPSEVERP